MKPASRTIGTNAPKLRDGLSALAKRRCGAGPSAYDVLPVQDWHAEHDGNLRIIPNPTPMAAKRVLWTSAPDWLAG